MSVVKVPARNDKQNATYERNSSMSSPCYLCGKKASDNSDRWISIVDVDNDSYSLGSGDDLNTDSMAAVGTECVKQIPVEFVYNGAQILD